MPDSKNVVSATLSPIERGDGGDSLVGKGKGIKHLLGLFADSAENAVLELNLEDGSRVCVEKMTVMDNTQFRVIIGQFFW